VRVIDRRIEKLNIEAGLESLWSTGPCGKSVEILNLPMATLG
jgi:hypothetical protein